MRKLMTVVAVLGASWALVIPSEAQQAGTPGTFAGGFTPTNIQFKPVSFGNAMQPHNLNNAISPQSQSTKVFDIGSAFHSMTMPLFRSTVPKTPILKPGRGNPLQPNGNQVKPH